MVDPHRFPVPTAALGRVAVGDVLWRYQGARRLTIVVKACFRLTADRPMVLVAPDPIRLADAHHGGASLASVARASEIAPRRPRVDVVLTGEAQSSQPVREMTVRLALRAGDRVLLDKSVQVVGDRAKPGDPTKTFTAMPLRYERAFGGPNHSANLLGVGMNEQGPQPNLLPGDGMATDGLACFAPVPKTFPGRQALRRALTSDPGERLMTDLGKNVDFAYYQVAPRDQQLDGVAADAWLTVQGVTAGDDHVQSELVTQLPGVEAAARLWHAEGAVDVSTHLDTIAIDTQRRICSLVWRGETPVATEGDTSTWLAAGALVFCGLPHQWPSRDELAVGVPIGQSMDGTIMLGATARPGSEPSRGAPDLASLDSGSGSVPDEALDSELYMEETVSMSAVQLGQAGSQTAVPFPRTATDKPAPARPIPGAPWTEEAAPEVPAVGVFGEQTVAHSDAEVDVQSEIDEAQAEAERLAGQQEALEAAAVEAAALREKEAEAFRLEQEAARHAEAVREREKTERQRAKHRTIRKGLYGVFKKPK